MVCLARRSWDEAGRASFDATMEAYDEHGKPGSIDDLSMSRKHIGYNKR